MVLFIGPAPHMTAPRVTPVKCGATHLIHTPVKRETTIFLTDLGYPPAGMAVIGNVLYFAHVSSLFVYIFTTV